MDREQKELLLEIAQWHIKDFNNEMIARWGDENYYIKSECRATIYRLTKEYTDKYGELPKWEYIDDVCNAAKQLREELK